VTGMVLRESGRVVFLGVAIGMAGALVSSRLMGALLFGVAPDDVATHATVGVTLFMVAMTACWWPARKAARLNPIESLRQG
jgi:putative ABC transport system permease protein